MEKSVNFITPIGTSKGAITPIEGFNHYFTESGQTIIKVTSKLNKKIPLTLRSLGGFYSVENKEYLTPLYYLYNPLKEALAGANNITSKLLGNKSQDSILKELIASNPTGAALTFTAKEHQDLFKNIKVTPKDKKEYQDKINTLALLESKQPTILVFNKPIQHPITGDNLTAFKLENKTTLIPVGNSRESGFNLKNFKHKFREGHSLGFIAILEKDYTGEKVKLSAPQVKEKKEVKKVVKKVKPKKEPSLFSKESLGITPITNKD